MDQPVVWIPTLVLAHAFACFWLGRALFRLNRRVKHQQPDAKLAKRSSSLSRVFEHDTACPPDQDAVPSQSENTAACVSISSSRSLGPDREINLEWQGLGCCYSLSRNVRKVVLQNVWGKAYPGQMQALMGPSGAGKSTCLDMLAMRKSVGKLTGRLLANGRPASSSFIRHSSYVPQDDTFIASMSSRETLAFYAGVMLGKAWSRTARKERVAQVLDAMGLSNSADTPVGGTLPGGLSLRGLSGGERRRLSIAAGILGAPSVLFLDEPTSGLDSFAALSVMGHLQELAVSTRQTVIATIHQPRCAIWGMFDMVTLLAGGRLLYHGPCDEMTPWFESVGYAYKAGLESVSDWVLDLVATGFSKPQHLFGHTLRTQEDVDRLATAFMSHSIKGVPDASSNPRGTAITMAMTNDPVVAIEDKEEEVELRSCYGTGQTTTYPTSWWSQFMSLTRRELANMTRNPFDVAARMLTATYVALIYSLFAYNSDLSSLLGMQSMSAYLFTAIMVALLLPYISISLFTNDKRIYLADASAKLYRPSAYYLAKAAVSMPFSILNMLAFSGVWYGLGSLRAGAPHFGRFYCIMVMMYLIGNQVLHMCAIFAPNLDVTFALSVTWTCLQLPTCSFIIPFTLVHLQGITVLRYISAAYFAFEALMVNQFQGSMVDCSGGIDAGLVSSAAGGFPNMNGVQRGIFNQLSQPQPRCIFKQDVYLDILSLSRPFYVSVLVLVGYLALLHIITFTGLLLVARHERR